MNSPLRVVRAPKDALLVRAAATFLGATLVGLILERTGIVASSPLGRLDEAFGAPVVLLTGAAVGALTAIILLRDGLRHELRFEDDALVVTNAMGRSRVLFDNIASVGHTLLGPGIALKDVGAWLGTFEGSPAAKRKQERIASFTASKTGCELAFSRRLLDVPPAELLAELRARAGLPDPAPEVEQEPAVTA